MLHNSRVDNVVAYVGKAFNATEEAIRVGESNLRRDMHAPIGGNSLPPKAVNPPGSYDAMKAAANAKASVTTTATHDHFTTSTTAAIPPQQVTGKRDKDEVHTVFSTDCTPYQDWQTIVLFHSATVVKQKGPITRIASGCNEEKQKTLTELYNKLYPQYHVHFTPDFKKDASTGRKYDFYNKPWGMLHWLQHANPPLPDDMVVALLDPDMVFLRPITTKIAGVSSNIFAKRVDKKEIVERVVEGHPTAQLYGLGAPWTRDDHPKFGRARICGENSPCLEPKEFFAARHYSVGPPYIVHRKDMIRIVKTWTEFVPRVYEKYPYLLAEMYAYSMAAAHENLPHLQFENHMVSNVDVHPGEGWPHVDKLYDVCLPPNEEGIYFSNETLPTVMHFCQFYRAGPLGFQKRRLPRDIFNCDKPLLLEPPSDLGFKTWAYKKGERIDMQARKLKRNAFAICVMHRSINAALIDFKQRMCAGQPTNFTKSHQVA